MPDDVARALGAAEPKTVTIKGKMCQVKPLMAKELAEVERECLRAFKDEYLNTFGRNLHHIPNKRSHETVMDREIQKVAMWDISDLPPKKAYDATEILITQKMRRWIERQYAIEGADDRVGETEQLLYTNRLKRLCSSALDQGVLSPDKYTALTNGAAPVFLVPYVHWWITGCHDGMLTLAWKAFQREGVSKEDVEEEFGANQQFLSELTRDIESASVPAVGNG